MSLASRTWRPVVLLGLISLLTAISGEAARGVSGPFLKQLGAGAAAVGFVAGAGELLGYTLRLGAGFFADKPGGAWRLLFAGTVLGIAAVPLLAVAPGWQIAAALFLAERIGRALRTPARDVLLSSASERLGHGPGFGVHRLLDQTGAVIGPLALAALFSTRSGYRTAFALLFLPSLAGLLLIEWVRRSYPDLGSNPVPHGKPTRARLPGSFWVLCAAAGLLAAGTADFALISFHLARQGRATLAGVPLLYAAAMAVEGVAAVALGFVLPRIGPLALLITIAASVITAPLVFLAAIPPALGVIAWSAGMGGQYAVLRALVPARVAAHTRGAAFGWFNTSFGVGWFLGSAVMGLLYSRNLFALVWFAAGAQLSAAPLVFWLARNPPSLTSRPS